jgi:Na+/H+ antiporter NhaC
VPFSIPIAFSLSGGNLGPIVFITVGAIMGGGVFGDHCSPVSDTTCLSSFGAASDHMDHVVTQLPYALLSAVIAFVLFVILGMTM